MNDQSNCGRLWLRWLAGVALAGMAAGGVLFLVVGKSVTEKLLTELFMPMGLLWMLLTVLCAVLLVQKNYRVFWLAAIAWVFCLVAGNGFVSNWLISSLETEYYDVEPLKSDPLDTVVLLGGATGEAPNGEVQINENGDRIVLAARMYHLHLAGRIICTGARIEGLSTLRRDEADASRLLLVDLGVPESVIGKYGGRNTFEEMQQISAAVGPDAKVGIITSAWHMPRAMRLAKSAGLNAVPLPADFSGQRNEDKPLPLGKIIRRCIPNQSALSTNSRVMKEHLARLVGR